VDGDDYMVENFTREGGEKSSTLSKVFDDASLNLSKEGNQFPEVGMAFSIPVHRSITEEAVGGLGVRGGTALAQLKGGDTAEDVEPSTRNDHSHHFDNNELKGAMSRLDKNQHDIDKMLYKRALTLDDESKILDVLGHRFHTYQDFYAHSNYIEQQLKQNPRLKPNEIPLVNFDDIRSGKASGVHTGFTVKDETLRVTLQRDDVVGELLRQGDKIPGTNYMSTAGYQNLHSFQSRMNYFTDPKYSFLHRDINKDDGHSDEGRTVNPYTGIRLYDYARNLAVRETQRQWKAFEDRIHQLRGKEYGDEIIYQMKTLNYDPRPDSPG
jgi:hypothetical protein